MLSCLTFKYEAIILTETWNNETTSSLCTLDGYKGYHTFRNLSRGGGVSVFISNLLKVRKIDELCFCNETIESCAVCIEIGGAKVIIIGIYRPHTDNISNFNHVLENLLGHEILNSCKVFILGDFNLNLSNQQSEPVLNFQSLLSSLHYIPFITKPTRFDHSRANSVPSLLDQIWINDIFSSIPGIILYDVSDHLPSFIHVNLPFINNATSPDRHKITFRPFSDTNLQNLKQNLAETNWDLLFDNLNPNLACSTFLDHLDKLYCKNFPIKHKFISTKRLNNPWITKSIKCLINLKSNFYKMFRTGHITKAQNNILKNRLNKEIFAAKKSYHGNLFNRYKNNMKKTWEVIRNLSGRPCKHDPIKSLFVGSESITDPVIIAQKFNEYFTSIADDLDSDLTQTDISPYSLIQQNIPHCFFLHPTDEYEISSLISKLKITKTDSNKMPVKIFMSIKSILAYPVSKLINQSFSEGIFPQTLKLARVTPIFKKGEKSDPQNYRPISSLPYLSKIFENCMKSRIVSYFNKFNLFAPSQFGFLKNKSTNDALFELTEKIYESLNSKNHHLSILVDLRKAFDVVNHDILLNKLKIYGFRGLPLKWVSSYLKDRECYVSIANHQSNPIKFNIGVPQGSILGPILFLIYINDLPRFSNRLNSVLYADDTTLSFSHRNFSEMTEIINSELIKLEDWTHANRLTINADKTETIIFSNRKTDVINDQIKLSRKSLAFVDSCKFLGVHLDINLKFSVHIQYIINKISKNCGIFYKIKDSMPHHVRLNYYYAMIYPYLSYNISIWGGTSENHLNPLFILQKRMIRNILDASKLQSSDPLFKRLGILKLKDIYFFQILIFAHKYFYDDKFHVQHNFNTRNRNFAAPIFQRLTLTQQSFSYAGPSNWNKLPLYLRSIQSLYVFKKKLKQYFIDKYAD